MKINKPKQFDKKEAKKKKNVRLYFMLDFKVLQFPLLIL